MLGYHANLANPPSRIVLLTIAHTISFRENQDKFPEPSEVPAINSILSDAELFGVLIRSLRRSAVAESDTQPGVGRKRSMSLSEKKVTALSPVPGRTKTHELKTPKFEVPVFAAVALYSAFRWLDHWPAPLVQAYADDCFGPRNWVDKPQCAKLVENLALVHSPSREAPDEESKDAAVMAQTYRLQSKQFQRSDSRESENSLKRRAELKRGSSSTSWGSLTNKAKRVKDDKSDEFDSGNEERDIELSVSDLSGKTTDVSPTDAKVASKKRKLRDDDEDGRARSKAANGAAPNGLANTTRGPMAESSSHTEIEMNGYPVVQTTLNAESVRHRYVGSNLELAHETIVACLAERVDVKSKHNSGLLQCLPSFTSIPGVRAIIASSLEKWLQSPALAGLARKLLATTVSDMKNVDPPLDQDLRAIGSILGMKLKANQVRIFFIHLCLP